jgi:hypothetical protein
MYVQLTTNVDYLSYVNEHMYIIKKTTNIRPHNRDTDIAYMGFNTV